MSGQAARGPHLARPEFEGAPWETMEVRLMSCAVIPMEVGPWARPTDTIGSKLGAAIAAAGCPEAGS